MELKLSPDTPGLLKQSVPLVSRYRVEIAVRAYRVLFTRHPELRAFFTRAEAQPQKLGHAVIALVEHLDHPDAFNALVDRIVTAHVGAAVPLDFHASLMDAFAAAIPAVMQKDSPGPIEVAAWTEFLKAIEGLLIEKETAVYETHEQQKRAEALGFVVS